MTVSRHIFPDAIYRGRYVSEMAETTKRMRGAPIPNTPARRAKADKIKDWVLRKDFLNKTHYAGDFVGGKYWPYKNWRSGYYEIKYENRIIRAKIFRQTWTTYDPEVEDRKKFPVDLRRNLTKPLKVK